MARKVSAGAVGQPSVSAIVVETTANLTTGNDLDISISPAGTGRFVINNNTQIQNLSDLRFSDSNNSNWVAFHGPETISADVTWTLPDADGTNNQVLTTNGSGILSWTSKDIVISDQTTSSATHYLTLTTATTGIVTSLNTSSSKLSFQPSTGDLTKTAKPYFINNDDPAIRGVEWPQRPDANS